ncbi:MAG TPA: DUF2235 domain-containing protein [Allosphingosinicella sp.]|nr:DUF2235 domain-containing protein [Allosphingosinicella sp.]
MYEPAGTRPSDPRDIFIALDGTGSNQLSRTNVSRLYELVDNAGANRPRATYYGEGVGTGARFVGAATGWGIGQDVREAYLFLIDNWRSEDRLFLSGFSRGAYTARILGGLIAVAGIPDLSKYPPKERPRIVERIYDAYKTKRRPNESLEGQNRRRLQAITRILGERPRGAGGGIVIEALALWDTVEALGLPDRTIDPLEDLDQYFLTVCNVKAAFHALALDDNRAYSFTPIFINTPAMRKACPNWHPQIEEVWFAGAHADVGGSYTPGGRTDGFLPGVSLNWMLDKLRHYRLFDASARAFEDPEGPIHDAKAYSAAYKPLYRYRREPLRYASKVPEVNGGKPFVHESAIRRLARAKMLDRRFDRCTDRTLKPRLLCSEDLEANGFVAELKESGCLIENEDGFVLREGERCVTIVTPGEAISSPASGTPWRMAD